MKIEVLHSSWGADGDVYAAGEHDLAKPSKKLVRLIAGAEAAGAVTVVQATAAERKALDGHVQSQEDGEAAYDKAVADGSWQHGNLTHFVLGRQDRLAYDDTLADDDEEKLDDAGREKVQFELEQAQATLAETAVPK